VPARRLGFAVKVLAGDGLPSHDTRRWQSGPHLRTSIDRLEGILDHLAERQIPMYRLASGFVPYATHPELHQFRSQLEECAEELARVGVRVREQGLRLSSHPGQYVVLNSTSDEVRRAAVRDVDLQARLFDAMGLGDEAVVVLHVGGAEGGTAAGRERFLRGVEGLSESGRRRLVVENDDRTFSLRDALDAAGRADLRVVWDVLHHHCHDPDRIPDREALELALATWPAGQTPKIHYSSPKTAVEERRVRRGRRVERRLVLPQLRAHADMVDPIAFEEFVRGPARGLHFDVMLEAKAKDVALLRLRDQLAERGIAAVGGRLLCP
jgi:UV DNA damage endonuclease